MYAIVSVLCIVCACACARAVAIACVRAIACVQCACVCVFSHSLARVLCVYWVDVRMCIKCVFYVFILKTLSFKEAAARGVNPDKCHRHVQMRIGVVMGAVQGKALYIGRGRGFLPIIRLPFCLGLGGIIGSGTQYLPWIHIDDMV
jgi:hypothetical protein